jgi:hypothetical protein
VSAVGSVTVVTTVGRAAGARAAAAALACAGSEVEWAGLLIDLSGDRPSRASLIATTAARELEERLVAHLPEAVVAARGQLCQLTLQPDRDSLEGIAAALPIARGSTAVVHLPPHLLRVALGERRIRLSGVLLRADLATDRELTALAARDLLDRDLRVAVLKRPLGWIASRLALSGAPLAGGGLPTWTYERLLGVDPAPRS